MNVVIGFGFRARLGFLKVFWQEVFIQRPFIGYRIEVCELKNQSSYLLQEK